MTLILALIDTSWLNHDLGWTGESMLRLTLAMVLGGLIGLERELRGRQAGFRTYLLVCLGSALVMLVSVSFARENWDLYTSGDHLRVDPGRIAYGVMTGVGFLGAGTIIHNRGSIRGLTTAAGIWCTAAIGLAAGFGQYVTAGFATGLVLLALWLLDYSERFLPQRKGRIITVRGPYHTGIAEEVAKRLQSEGFTVSGQNFHRDEKDRNEVEITMRVSLRGERSISKLEHIFSAGDGLELVSTRES